MSKTIEDRIKALKVCAKAYYSDGTSTMTDPEYDAEYDAVQALAPNHPFFEEVGSQEDHIYGTKVKHVVTMGSLHKSKDTKDFLTWLQATYGNEEITVIVQFKIDGLSLGCIYDKGKLVRAVTRGNGEEGVDVTDNARFVYGVQQSIDYKGEVEVRGEVYKDRQDFYKNWAVEYKNPRNFSAGSLNQKDPKVTKARGLSFVSYEVVRKDFTHETWKLKWLIDNKFHTLRKSTKKFKGTPAQIAKSVQKYMDDIDRGKLPYDIDGVVVKLNDVKAAKAMGTTSGGKRPKANRAVKFPCEQKATAVNGIEWNVGRTGQLTPVGLLEPVELSGTTVKRVSLHNIKNMYKLRLRPGAKVLIQKSGDIIPYVVRKVSDGSGKFTIPSRCPSCGEEMEWDADKVTKWCQGTACPAQMASTIEHWFKKLGVKGIGPGTIKKLLKSGKVKSISDMYNLSGDPGFATIVKSVDSVKKISLAKFIEALGIGQIGTMSKDITEIAPEIADIDALTVTTLAKVDGFAETKAKAFVNGWKAQRDEIGKILAHMDIVVVKPDSDKLVGKKFCFTGSFSDPTRKEMEAMVGSNGGKVSSVSAKLTALVWDGEMEGSKLDKAKKLGLDIIDQQTFLDMLK